MGQVLSVLHRILPCAGPAISVPALHSHNANRKLGEGMVAGGWRNLQAVQPGPTCGRTEQHRGQPSLLRLPVVAGGLNRINWYLPHFSHSALNSSPKLTVIAHPI